MSTLVPTTGTSGFSYRPALDGLRAFAVLAVILYHLDYPWARGGFLGVDTFFVLSGYLITSLLLVEYERRSRISLPGFWTRRVRRLLPAIILLLLAVASFAAFEAATVQLDTLRGDSLATLFYVANWRFVLEGTSYFELWSEASPLRHMWSLAIEEQFYLLWPLLTFGLLRLGRGGTRWLGAFIGAGTVASVALMAALYDTGDPSRAYFGTDTRAHSLLVGAALAIVLARAAVRSVRTNRVLQLVGLVAAAGVLWSYARVSDTGAGFYRGGSLVFALATAVVVAASVQAEWSPLRVVLDRQPFLWIGQVSYGLYLWHWPMIVWLNRGRTGIDGWELDVVRVAATFTLATLSYYLVERPIRYGDIPRVRVALVTPAMMAVTAVVIVGATVGGTTNPLEFSGDFEIPALAEPQTPATGAASTGADGSPGVAEPEAVDAAGELASVGSRPVHVVALVGDSVASTIAQGLGPAFQAAGKEWVSVAFPGCGIAAGWMLQADGRPFDWTEACYENLPKTQTTLVEEHDPDVVLWHSTWELTDREEDGARLRFGTPEHDAALERDVADTVDRLTANGARVVFLLAAPNSESDVRAADDGSAMEHLNALLRRYADEHPQQAVVVDLNPIVCPTGPPCPARVDGIQLRPDGGHYSEEGSAWLAARVMPEIVRALQ